jgi:hypothetical protein
MICRPQSKVLLTASLAVFLAAHFAADFAAFAQQQPVPPVPPVPPQQESSTAKSKPQSKERYSHANDFLIRGTVFNDQALAFPGVQLRVKRAGEKKFHWQTVTNSRGDFALRVPQGSTYELLVRVKGFADQSRSIDAKNGGAAAGYVFRLQPLGGKS